MELAKVKLVWSSRDDVLYPFQTKFEGSILKVRLNDFPAEIMYSLIVDDKELVDFDNWPKAWVRKG